MNDVVVHSLHVYPIKSTSGIDMDGAKVGPLGIEHDRRWAVVGPDNEVLTAREFPELLGVQAEILGHSLVVKHAGIEQFTVPDPGDNTAESVTIFGAPAAGVPVEDTVNRWFSKLLGVKSRLVYMSSKSWRPLLPEHGGREGDPMSYADQCPLLLVSRASLDDLNTRLETAVSMRNFRPNIVVSGCGPYAEDEWRRIESDGVTLEVSQQCRRCVLTTMDPETHEKHPRQEPLRTLSGYRRHPPGGVCFGVHLVPRSTGSLRVGDRLAVH